MAYKRMQRFSLVAHARYFMDAGVYMRANLPWKKWRYRHETTIIEGQIAAHATIVSDFSVP